MSKELHGFVFGIIPIALFYCSSVIAAAPEWIKNDTLIKNGSVLTVVCVGSGPSLDIGRRLATDQCKSTAAEQANSSARIKSLSIQTEKTISFHEEISSNKKIINLTCNPEKEYFEIQGDSYHVWIKCRFDLSRAQVVNSDKDEDTAIPSGSVDSLIKNHDNISSVPKYNSEYSEKKRVTGENRSFTLISIPQCQTILIRGEKPRSVNCDEMPKTFLVYPNDTELIVRASGYLPKHIELNTGRVPGNQTTETLEVYLERQ